MYQVSHPYGKRTRIKLTSLIHKNHQLSKRGNQSKQLLYAKLKSAAALCYPLCRKADKLRKQTQDANATRYYAFPVGFPTTLWFGSGAAEKQEKSTWPSAHIHSMLYVYM